MTSTINAEDETPMRHPSPAGSSATMPTTFRYIHPPPLQLEKSQQRPMRVATASHSIGRSAKLAPITTAADASGEKPAADATTPCVKPNVPKPPNSTLRPISAATLTTRLKDNTRSTINTLLPHLAGQSTGVVLRTLEDERRSAEAEGDFIKAQERVEMMRAFAEYCGKKVGRDIVESAERSAEVAEKSSHYRMLMFEFTKMWEEKFSEYDVKAEEAMLELQSEQQRRFEEVESLTRCELAARRPHYSRKVITKREELERLLTMRHYKEADRVRRDLSVIEEADERKFEESLNVTLAARTKALRRQQETKMDALKMRITQGREELMLQRRTDYFNLLLKHANGIEEAQQSHRQRAATERQYLHRQLSAMMIKSSTKNVNFEKILTES